MPASPATKSGGRSPLAEAPSNKTPANTARRFGQDLPDAALALALVLAAVISECPTIIATMAYNNPKVESLMPTSIDVYWSFRSPYSYLATQGIRKIQAERDVAFNLKIVLPLAIRDPHFFDSRGPSWLGYVMRDIIRIAQMTGQPIAMLNPDPIIQDMATAKIAEDQPHIWRLSRLGLAAVDAGQGLAFIDEVSRLIWSGLPWTEDDNLAEAIARAGLDLSGLEKAVKGHEAEYDARFDLHDQELRKAGHWGVPTCVLDNEPFFGMDRLPILEWRLDQMGIG